MREKDRERDRCGGGNERQRGTERRIEGGSEGQKEGEREKGTQTLRGREKKRKGALINNEQELLTRRFLRMERLASGAWRGVARRRAARGECGGASGRAREGWRDVGKGRKGVLRAD